MNIKEDKKLFPKTVLAMYLKLYYSRRGTSKNKMVEALKSWLTLTTKEKQYFYKKYKEYQRQHKIKIADSLKKTEPFMKKKHVNRFTEDKTSKMESVIDFETVREPNCSNSECHDEFFMETINNTEPNIEDSEMTCHDDEEQLEPVSQNDSVNNTIGSVIDNQSKFQEIIEPTPPSVRTGKELFEMLNTDNEQTCTTWSSISRTQKTRYHRAAASIKNEYIKHFKTFLENLPSKKLFDYYNDFFN